MNNEIVINNKAFSFSGLNSFRIPENVSEIASDVFEQCTYLLSITINSPVTVPCSGCGFPYVTIEGSLEDWTKINSKLNDLKKK